MKAKSIVSALVMLGAMMTAPLFAQSACEAVDTSCNACTPCVQVVCVRPKCDLFTGVRCRPCVPACKPACEPCKPACEPCKPACTPCKPARKLCKPVCKPVCVPCKPVCKPVCVPACKKFIVKPVCAPVCAPACAPEAAEPACAPEAVEPACTPCAPVCKPVCKPVCAPVCAPACAPACTPCTPCCAPCRPLISLFRQIKCDLQIAACQLDYDIQMAGCKLANLRCTMQANIAQCKAEADAREACRLAARSGYCGEVEVCVPNRIRPGAAMKGILRTLFGSNDCCAPACEASCGCEAAPACGCEAEEPACAPAEGTATPAADAETAPAPEATTSLEDEMDVLTPASITEDKEEEVDASILPEADPTSISANYNPSNSIVLR